MRETYLGDLIRVATRLSESDRILASTMLPGPDRRAPPPTEVQGKEQSPLRAMVVPTWSEARDVEDSADSPWRPLLRQWRSSPRGLEILRSVWTNRASRSIALLGAVTSLLLANRRWPALARRVRRALGASVVVAGAVRRWPILGKPIRRALTATRFVLDAVWGAMPAYIIRPRASAKNRPQGHPGAGWVDELSKGGGTWRPPPSPEPIVTDLTARSVLTTWLRFQPAGLTTEDGGESRNGGRRPIRLGACSGARPEVWTYTSIGVLPANRSSRMLLTSSRGRSVLLAPASCELWSLIAIRVGCFDPFLTRAGISTSSCRSRSLLRDQVHPLWSSPTLVPFVRVLDWLRCRRSYFSTTIGTSN